MRRIDNMKEITMFELLVLIKDDKAPKRFIKDDTLYIYDKEYKVYYFDSGSGMCKGFNFDVLNEKILVVDF